MKTLIQRSKPFLLMMLFALTLLAPTLTQAQVATNYNFASSGPPTSTYTSITGGTVLGVATNDDTSFGDGAAFPIGFNFSYSGTTMTHFAVQSNGFIALGTNATMTISSSYTALSAVAGPFSSATDNLVCAFNADLQGQATTGELSHLLTGTAPNRTLVVQWKNYSFWQSSPTNGNFDFQIRLNETSNTINIVYGVFTSIPTRSAAAFETIPSVGLRGIGDTDYNNRTTATDWSATTAGTANTDVCAVGPTIFPVSGQTYTWTPASCIGVGGLNASPVGSTTATLNWSANPTATNGYNVQYRIVGAPAFIALPTITTGTTITTNLTGLLPATNYEFQVQSKCTGATVSSFSASRLFITACTSFTLPYTEDFESITVVNQLPVCMVKTAKTFTGIAPDTRGRVARSGSKYGYFQWNSTAGGDYIYSAPLQMTAGSTYQFSVWYVADGAAGWTNLDAWIGPNQTPIGLVAIPGASTTNVINTTYQELLGTFTVTTTGVYYVALRGLGNGVPWYITFDDLTVGPPPACIVPIGITTSALAPTTATVGWSAVAGSTGYNVQYRLVGATAFTPFPGNPVIGTSANLTGLISSSTYQVQVQNVCSTTLTSAFSPLLNFNTACAPITSIPYEEGFEGIATNDQLPNCTSRSDIDAVRTYAAAIPFSPFVARTGIKFGGFESGFGNISPAGEYFYSAALVLTAGSTYTFSVWYNTDGFGAWTALDAWVGTTQTPVGLVAIAGATVTSPSNTTYQELRGTFTVPSTGTYHVALRCGPTPGFFDTIVFDDLSVDNPCNGVTFSPATLPSGDLTTPYSQTITATGGTAPYVYSVSSGVIPAGLTFNTTTGVISGTPTTASISPPNFTIKVVDATGCNTSKTYSITVTSVPCATITVTPTTVPAGTIGVLYPPITFAATGIIGATYTYNVVAGNLPAGMTLTATGTNAGRLTGTPTTRPTAPITIRARVATGPSAGCFGTVTINLVINCVPIIITPAVLPDAVINSGIYSQILTATGGGAAGGTFRFEPDSTVSVTDRDWEGFSITGNTFNMLTTKLITPKTIKIKAIRNNNCEGIQTYTVGVVPIIAAPVQLDPMQISSSSFRARWEPVARATKYRIYVATSNDFDGGSFAIGYVGLAVVGDTSILVQNLKPETKYYIQITAISSADEVSPYSNKKDATTLSAVTGIDNGLSSQVKVSPNPSNDKFLVDFGTLNLGKTTARVYDAQGKQVFSSEINTSNTSNQTTIQLGNMAKGIYLLEIVSNKGRILKRLVKE